MLLGDILAHGARVRPGRGALITEGGSLTYGDLARGTDRYAAALRALGVNKGDRVAVMKDGEMVGLLDKGRITEENILTLSIGDKAI